MSSRNFPSKKRNISDCFNAFFEEQKKNWRLQLFLHEILLNYYLVGIFKESLCKFFAENVARGNSVQIGPDFPAKSLSIYTKEKF